MNYHGNRFTGPRKEIGLRGERRKNTSSHQKDKDDSYKECMDYLKKSILADHEHDYDTYIDKIKEYADFLKKGEFTTSMIRNVYSRLMKAKELKEIKRLRPQLAYIYGKNDKKVVVKDFMDMLDDVIKQMKSESEAESIKEFVEAVVAYMKYFGDND